MSTNHLQQGDVDTSVAETVSSRSMRRQTNVECVAKLMEFSRFGALAQAFVIDALTKHAEAVAKLTDEQIARLDNPMVSMTAWRGVATEIKTALDAHLSGVLVRDDSDDDTE